MLTTAKPSTLLRQQVAFIRTLLDELSRYAPSDVRATAIGAQIREEEARLALWIEGSPARSKEVA